MGDVMPDAAKHEQPSRIPGQQECERPRKPDPTALAKLLDEWMHGDEAEQRETFEFLRRALDEDRPTGRKLFS
jgi:hypothetical protein